MAAPGSAGGIAGAGAADGDRLRRRDDGRDAETDRRALRAPGGPGPRVPPARPAAGAAPRAPPGLSGDVTGRGDRAALRLPYGEGRMDTGIVEGIADLMSVVVSRLTSAPETTVQELRDYWAASQTTGR